MAAPVVVQFRADGVKAIQEAFKTVQKAALDAERAQIRSAANADRAQERSARDAERRQESRLRELQRKLSQEEKATEKAEKAKLRAVETATKQSLRDAAKAEDAKTAAFEKAEKRRLQLQINSARMAGKEMDRIARAQADAAEKTMAQRKRVTGGLAGSIMSSAGGALRTMAGVAGGITALGGGFSVVDSIQTASRNSGKAVDLANQSGGKVSRDQILSKASEAGTKFGQATESVIEGLDNFVAKSGNVDAGFKLIDRMLELATATGGDLKEMMRTAGIVQMSTNNADDTMDVMRTFAGQGRAGSVDMRELQQYGGRITSAAGMYADKKHAYTALGAIAQQAAATGGATDAAEATNAVVRFGEDAFKHEDRLKGLGVNIRDAKDKNKLRAPEEILKDVLEKTGGDPGKIHEIFGQMSDKAARGYANTWNDTKGGAKEKRAAVDKLFADFSSATLTEEQIRIDSAKRLQESDKQLEMALNELRDAVGKQLLPEFVKLIPKIQQLIPAFVTLLQKSVEFAEWFAANPLKGIGVVVMAAIVKDLAAAGIGSVVKSAIQSILLGAANGAAGGSGVANTVGGAAKGALDASATTAGAATVAGAAAIGTAGEYVNSTLTGQTEGQRKAGELLADAQSSDPKKRAAVKARLKEAMANTGIVTAAGSAYATALSLPGEAYSAVTGNSNPATDYLKKAEVDTQIVKYSERIAKALERAATASESVTNRPGANNPAQNSGMGTPSRGGAN